MSAPTNKLLRWAAMLGLPGALLSCLLPATAWFAWIPAGILLLTIVADLIMSVRRHEKLTVETAKLTRLTLGNKGSLSLILRHESFHPAKIRLALNMPSEVGLSEPVLEAFLSQKQNASLLEWPCSPQKRGCFAYSRCHIESQSRLGFWDCRSVLPLQGEVRIYPNLIAGRKNLSALLLRRGPHGFHAVRQLGKGREFEKLRDYIQGDSMDDLHWKATAKRNRPVTKVFQIERTREVHVILDISRLCNASVESFFIRSAPLWTGSPEPGRSLWLSCF